MYQNSNKFLIDLSIFNNLRTCFFLALFVDKLSYIAKVCDSRAILLNKNNMKIINKSQDHVPNLKVD